MLNLPYSDKICSVCIQGKGTRKPFNENRSETCSIGELIHTDIAGPEVTPIFEGYKYFQVLIGDFSNFLVVKLLKNKSEATQNLIDFIRLIKTKHNKFTQRIRCDNGGEFTSNMFKKYCQVRVISIYTMAYSPQQNRK